LLPYPFLLIFLVKVARTKHFQKLDNGTEFKLERDEEGNFRALVDPQKMNDNKIDLELLKAIVGAVEAL
jgi:hypothetical protein